MNDSTGLYNRLTDIKHNLFMSHLLTLDDIGDINKLWFNGELTLDHVKELEQWSNNIA